MNRQKGKVKGKLRLDENQIIIIKSSEDDEDGIRLCGSQNRSSLATRGASHLSSQTLALDIFEKARVLDELISMASNSDDLAKLLLKARDKLDYAHDLHFYDFANPARDARKLIDVLHRDI